MSQGGSGIAPRNEDLHAIILRRWAMRQATGTENYHKAQNYANRTLSALGLSLIGLRIMSMATGRLPGTIQVTIMPVAPIVASENLSDPLTGITVDLFATLLTISINIGMSDQSARVLCRMLSHLQPTSTVVWRRTVVLI